MMHPPDRWLNYTNYKRIDGTRFVALKVPLKEDYNSGLPDSKRFTPEMLLRDQPKIKLIIDLTFTLGYYDGVKEFQEKGVQYVKLRCVGHKIPSEELYNKFVSIVDEFIANNDQDYLIGVHCTHGVNRTGYFIVRYMIDRLGYNSNKALQDFSTCRGYTIEHDYYIDHLHKISEERPA